MICSGFKGGIGTASRVVKVDPETYTVGVLVQSNFGSRRLLRIAGVPVGLELANEFLQAGIRELPDERASIIIVVATDAPLLPQQIKRLARRAGMGLARTGSIAENGSGDLFIAFSTANPGAAGGKGVTSVQMLRNREMNPLFEATVQATEEAITNALVAAETMTGINDRKVMALPHDRVRQILKKYNRLVD
jgi:L-aminopeptidase/D-esterase-like protein